jgi:hypothetical protein
MSYSQSYRLRFQLDGLSKEKYGKTSLLAGSLKSLKPKTIRLTAHYITQDNFRLLTTWCAQEYAKLHMSRRSNLNREVKPEESVKVRGQLLIRHHLSTIPASV